MANQLNKESRFKFNRLDITYTDDLDATAIPLETFDPRNLPAGHNSLGYLNRSAFGSWTRTGGEVVVDDTANELEVDSSQNPIQRTFNASIEQLETRLFELLYGDGYDPATKEFDISSQPSSSTKLFQIVATTAGGKKFGWVTPGSISTTADMTLDPATTSNIPVSIKVLSHNGRGLRALGVVESAVEEPVAG